MDHTSGDDFIKRFLGRSGRAALPYADREWMIDLLEVYVNVLWLMDIPVGGKPGIRYFHRLSQNRKGGCVLQRGNLHHICRPVR